MSVPHEASAQAMTALAQPCEHIQAVKAEMERQNVRVVADTLPAFVCLTCVTTVPMELDS